MWCTWAVPLFSRGEGGSDKHCFGIFLDLICINFDLISVCNKSHMMVIIIINLWSLNFDKMYVHCSVKVITFRAHGQSERIV